MFKETKQNRTQETRAILSLLNLSLLLNARVGKILNFQNYDALKV